MAMQGSTLRILEAANFTPPQALALAEAIEGEIRGSDLATASAMDIRFSDLKHEIAASEARLTDKIMASGNRLTVLGISVATIIASVMLYLLKR